MKSTKDLQIILDAPGALSPIAALADIPEEDIWLAKQKKQTHATCVQTRRDALHAHTDDPLV
jgi:hypothetical protein